MLPRSPVVIGACVLAWLLLAGCSSSESARLERGRILYSALRCAQCHDQNAASAEGAPLAGIFQLPVTLTDGRTILRDDAYLARAIRDPHVEIVAGFHAQMPMYPTLPDEDVHSLVAYIKQLRSER